MKLLQAIGWVIDHLRPVSAARIERVIGQIQEAGRQLGVAQERFRILSAEGFGPDERAACQAALDQAQRAIDDIGRSAG